MGVWEGSEVPGGTDVRSASSVDVGDAARARLYAWLGEVLRAPPTHTTLKRLISGFPCSKAGHLSEPVPLQSALLRTQQAARRARVRALDDEFHALFIGLGRGELMPYGSWHITGFLMGRPLAQLRRDLLDLGIERRAGVSEPEDHVAALCETMSLLADPVDGVPLGAQSHFYNTHLAPWLGLFFADMQVASSARFYAAVGALGQAFVDVEQRYYEIFASDS